MKISGPIHQLLIIFLGKLGIASISEVMRRQIRKRNDSVLYFILACLQLDPELQEMAVKSFQARLAEYDKAAQNEYIKNKNAKRKESIGEVSNFEVNQGALKKIDENYETIQKAKEIKTVKFKSTPNVSPIGAVEIK